MEKHQVSLAGYPILGIEKEFLEKKPKSLRFFHSADWHFGSPMASLGKLSKQRRFLLKQAIVSFFHYAMEAQADACLLSGDLLEASHIDPEEVTWLKSLFSRVDLPIFLIAGNHDPLTADSPYHGEWPRNVHIFKKEQESYTFNVGEQEETSVQIYGYSFHEEQARTLLFSPSSLEVEWKKNHEQKQGLKLLLLHGQVVQALWKGEDALSSRQEELYQPLPSGLLENLGADYIALGHVHKATSLQEAERQGWAYSGSLLGRGYDECGKQGFFCIDFEETLDPIQEKRTYKRKVQRIIFEQEYFEHYTFSFKEDSKIEEVWSLLDQLANQSPKVYPYLHFQGKVSEEFLQGLQRELDMQLQLRFPSYRFQLRLQVAYPLELLKGEGNLRGEFIQNVLEQRDVSIEEKEKILQLGLLALEGKCPRYEVGEASLEEAMQVLYQEKEKSSAA